MTFEAKQARETANRFLIDARNAKLADLDEAMVGYIAEIKKKASVGEWGVFIQVPRPFSNSFEWYLTQHGYSVIVAVRPYQINEDLITMHVTWQ